MRCDLGHPACQRCRRAKLDCEGYERYPVFIDRTTAGIQKRKPLEEAKARDPSNVGQGLVPHRQLEPAAEYIVQLPHLPSRAIEACRFTSWFCETFIQARPSKHVLETPSHWLKYVFDLPSPEPVLSEALLAVSVTRCGKVQHNATIVREGRRLYTGSLRLLQHALSHPSLAVHEDILATAGLMILYELFDATSQTPAGWHNHLSGFSRLLQHRGPERHRSARSRAVLEHGRHLLMMQSLLCRHASPLSQPEWLLDPWQGVAKSIEQQVFDHGLNLGYLFERADWLVRAGADQWQVAHHARECLELAASLRKLSALHLPTASAGSCDSSKKTVEGGLAAAPAEVMLSITSLAIQLGACVTAADVDCKASNALTTSGSAPALAPVVATTIEAETPKPQHMLAKRIVDLVSTYLSPHARSVGAARLVFALRLARDQLAANGKALMQCEALLQRLGGQAWQFGALLDPATSTRS